MHLSTDSATPFACIHCDLKRCELHAELDEFSEETKNRNPGRGKDEDDGMFAQKSPQVARVAE